MKLVMDGCGSTPYPDSGVRLFAYMLSQKLIARSDWVLTKGEPHANLKAVIATVFEKILQLQSTKNADQFIFDFMLFTILIVVELQDSWMVLASGDGYIISHAHCEDRIAFEPLDCGEFPAYQGYNYIIDKNKLLSYKDGVGWHLDYYPKTIFKNVGVASDGIRFLVNLPEHNIERQRFVEFLKEDKCGKIKMLINRNQSLLTDDVSIVF